MPQIEFVEPDKRNVKRNIESSIRKDIVSYIVELVTNADDSYKRLEVNGKNVSGEIYIIVNKKGKKDFEISVVDFAEGMSREKMREVIKHYGRNNAGGVEKHVRGIFGQGASDVLRNASIQGRTATVESICDGLYNKLTYKIVEDKDTLKPGYIFHKDEPMRINDLFREKLGIWGNGTIITFGVPEGVDFGLKVQKSLRDLIEKNPNFRYLLDEDYSTRKVYLYQSDKGGLLSQNIKRAQLAGPLSSYKYRMNGEVLWDKPISFPSPYGGVIVKGNLKLFRKINQEDEAKIIVRDENYTVFDNNSFGFRNNLQDIVGELNIVGLYKICYDLLNRDERPKAILNDNRTGFNKDEQFYIVMETFVGREITQVLEKNKSGAFSIAGNKEVKEALSDVNAYIRDLFKDDTENIGGNVSGDEPPLSGIEFVNTTPTITKDKKHGLKLLINSDLVSPDDTINISIEDNNDNVEVSPLSISYDTDDVSDTGLVVKSVTIFAKNVTEKEKPVCISATCGEYISNAYVSVKDFEVHNPENGLEFYPNKDLNLVFDKPHTLKLYFNSDQIPVGSTIEIDSGGLIGPTSYEVVEKNIVCNNIGRIDVILNGGNEGEKYTVKASYGEKIAEANIVLINSKDQKIANGPLSFSSIDFDDTIDSWVQVYFDPRDGVIYINSSDEQQINKKFLGDCQNFKKGISQWGTEQKRYICELASICIAKELVRLKKGYKKREIETNGVVEDLTDSVRDALQKYKKDIFPKFYNKFFKGPNSR